MCECQKFPLCDNGKKLIRSDVKLTVPGCQVLNKITVRIGPSIEQQLVSTSRTRDKLKNSGNSFGNDVKIGQADHELGVVSEEADNNVRP